MPSSHEQSGRPSVSEISFAELEAAAAKIGMRLIAINTIPESEPQNVTTREEMLDFSASNNIASSIVFRGWRRLQGLYTSKVQLETVGLITTVSANAKLNFLDTEPIPENKPEDKFSWTGWRERLTYLEVSSFQLFVRQLVGNESLLGYKNGQTVHDLYKGFAHHLSTRA